MALKMTSMKQHKQLNCLSINRYKTIFKGNFLFLIQNLCQTRLKNMLVCCQPTGSSRNVRVKNIFDAHFKKKIFSDINTLF